MAATPSIKVVKSWSYRGTTRQFSNRYHFVGGIPADTAHWTTLSDAITAAEKAIFASGVTIVETVGYHAGSEVPVFTKTYSLAGTFNPAGYGQTPGDVAAIVRYATTARTAKNHPVYLYNYYHGAYCQLSPADQIANGQATAIGTYAGAWVGAGFSDGTTTYNRAGPNGATAVGYVVDTYLSHRDLPR